MGQENPAGGGTDAGQQPQKRVSSRLWVPVVLLVGTILGVAAYKIATEVSGFPHFNRPGQPFGFGPDIFLEFHIIFSTIGIGLLIALIVVYVRTYLQTRANFILGLLVVLFALLLQSLLTYPVLLELETGFAIEVFSPVADVFTIIAYAVFLYLSLE